MTPLTVPEARAILAADAALDATFAAREASGKLLGLAESDAWIKLVASATDRVASFERGALCHCMERAAYRAAPTVEPTSDSYPQYDFVCQSCYWRLRTDVQAQYRQIEAR
jgi:hypothetical protein